MEEDGAIVQFAPVKLWCFGSRNLMDKQYDELSLARQATGPIHHRGCHCQWTTMGQTCHLSVRRTRASLNIASTETALRIEVSFHIQ